MDGYCFKSPNRHGILARNLKIPANQQRLFIALRWLKPEIKQQAMNHKDSCLNQDNNIETMKACKCCD